MKKVALQFSGQCRTLDKTIESIRTRVLDRLSDYDVFMYLPDDEDSKKSDLLKPTKVEVVKDQHIDERNLINNKTIHAKKGVQSYLQQLNGIYQVNELRKRHEQEAKVQYDVVIRIRLDTLFKTDLPDVEKLQTEHKIYIPDFHHWKGYNDRFAIGNPKNMDIYCSLFKNIFRLTTRIEGESNNSRNPFEYSQYRGFPKGQNPIPFLTKINNCEMFLKVWLDANNVQVATLPFYFNRVRVGGNLVPDAPMMSQGRPIFRVQDSINLFHNHDPL